MQWWEVNRVRAGIQRRYRTQLWTTRWQITYLANMFRKESDPPIKAKQIADFPWEKDQSDITPEEEKALQREMAFWNGISPTIEDPQ